MDEFEFIERIRRRVKIKNRGVLLGIGDDCAILRISRDALITVDSAVEDVHFKMGWGFAYQLGRKLVRANISDLFSKGGEGVAAFLSVGVNMGDKRKANFISRYIDGIIDELNAYKIELSGGNVSAVKDRCFFDLFLLGSLKKGNFRGRNGASPSDLIAIDGPIGDSSAGLFILSKGLEKRGYERLIKRFLNPEIRPHYKSRIWDYVTSSIDISDGLIGDLGHILKSSRCGARVDVDRIPVSDILKEFCKRRRLDIFEFILSGGEDYRLLVTLRSNTPQSLIEESNFVVIGNITRGSALQLLGVRGKYTSFKHF